MARKKKKVSQSDTQNTETSTQQIKINSMSEAYTSTVEQNTESTIPQQVAQPVAPDDVASSIIENYTTNMTQEEINKLLQQLLSELNIGLYEKERSIRLTLLAVLAGESTFMLGEPGTAKSLVSRRISEAFEDCDNEDEIKFFDYLMNQFSTPEEIFGPVSIQELKNDNYIRKTDHYLPKAQFAFLDEIWKANPAIQNALLTILNERIFRNGVNTEKVSLIGFMSASNELPEKGKGLEAIFDRFLVRILEKPISDNNNFRNMISSGRENKTEITKKLSKDIIQQILEESEAVEISEECFGVIDYVRKIITDKNKTITDENEKYMVSDRRWKKIANLMRVSAYCNNRIETDVMDATLIADCIWSTEKQESDAKQIVADAIKAYGVKCKANLADLKKQIANYKKDIDSNFFEERVSEEEPIIKIIEGKEYYEVQNTSDKKEVFYISKNKVRIGAYNTGGYYSTYDHLQREIYAEFDSDSMEYKYNNGAIKYQVCTTPAKTVLEKKDLPEITKDALIETFTKRASDINKSIKNEVDKIDSDIKEQKEQYSSNLFSDINHYSKIIFNEQIIAKNELQKLSDELVNAMSKTI